MSIGQWEAIADIGNRQFSVRRNPPAGLRSRCGRGGGRWGMSRGKSARVGFINDDVMAAAIAPDAQERSLVLRVLRQPHGVFGIFDRLTIDLKNDVTRL